VDEELAKKKERHDLERLFLPYLIAKSRGTKKQRGSVCLARRRLKLLVRVSEGGRGMSDQSSKKKNFVAILKVGGMVCAISQGGGSCTRAWIMLGRSNHARSGEEGAQIETGEKTSRGRRKRVQTRGCSSSAQSRKKKTEHRYAWRRRHLSCSRGIMRTKTAGTF